MHEEWWLVRFRIVSQCCFPRINCGSRLTCVCSWGPPPPRCWSWGWTAPLSSGSWCRHCPLRHTACHLARPPRHCCADSAYWLWLSTCCSVHENNAGYTVVQIHPQTPDLGDPGNKLIALMMNWSSTPSTWGSYFSTVARCEELSYPPTAYKLPSGTIKSKQSGRKY